MALVAAPDTTWDQNAKQYRHQQYVPKASQRFFSKTMLRKYVGRDPDAANAKGLALHMYWRGVFKRLELLSEADAAYLETHPFDKLPETINELVNVLAAHEGRRAISSYIMESVGIERWAEIANKPVGDVAMQLVAAQKLLPSEAPLRAEAAQVNRIVANVAPAPSPLVPAEESLDALFTLWLKSFGKNAPRRTSDHQTALREFKAFMAKPMRWCDVTKTDAMNWRDALEGEGKSPERIVKLMALMSAMFNGALSETYGEENDKSNPFQGGHVKPRGWKKRDKTKKRDAFKTFQAEWTKALIAQATTPPGGKHPFGTFNGLGHERTMELWLVCRRTGARPQEITQLQRGDLIVGPDGLPALLITDQDAGRGHTRKHVQKELKTAESGRTVPLHVSLHDWWRREKEGDKGEQIYAALDWDKEKGRTVWFSRSFHKLMAQCPDVPHRVFYNFRHTYITAIASVAARLGFKPVDHEYMTAHGAVTMSKRYQDPAEFAELRRLVEAVDLP